MLTRFRMARLNGPCWTVEPGYTNPVKTHQFRINFAVAFDEVTSDAEMSEATALPRLALVGDQVTSVERLLDGLTAFQVLEKASALYLSYT